MVNDDENDNKFSPLQILIVVTITFGVWKKFEERITIMELSF